MHVREYLDVDWESTNRHKTPPPQTENSRHMMQKRLSTSQSQHLLRGMAEQQHTVTGRGHGYG